MQLALRRRRLFLRGLAPPITITLNLLRVDTFIVATTNLFGDILSDQASCLAGRVGLAPSLNAGGDHAMAQAVHGTAPDIAGKGLANPAATDPVDRTITELAVSADECAGMPLDCAAPPARRCRGHQRRHLHCGSRGQHQHLSLCQRGDRGHAQRRCSGLMECIANLVARCFCREKLMHQAGLVDVFPVNALRKKRAPASLG